MSETVTRETGTRSGLIDFLTLANFANLNVRDIGLLVLRIGTLPLIMHGWAKLTNFEGFAGGAMANIGLTSIAPTFFAFLVVAGQILLPIFIMAGLFTRWSGLLQAVLFFFIIVMVNIPGGMWSEHGGFSFDSSLYYFFPGLALFFLGAGRISIDHMLNKVEDLGREHVVR